VTATAIRPIGDFGRTLREARERKGVSLRQIANTTKISIGMLDALERNDVSRLPGGVFSRAFVRSYACEVGLDPDSTLKDFAAQFGDEAGITGHPASRHMDGDEMFNDDRRLLSTVVRLAVVCVLIAAAIIVYLVVARRRSPTTIPPSPAATLKTFLSRQ
jgi:cytoskeletal protein RodZ